MMNKYEYLANKFIEELGIKFNLVFNNDEALAWEDILLEPSEMVSGVMHVNSGNYENTNGIEVETQQIALQFMIPTEINIFSEAVQTIEDTFKSLHNYTFEYEGKMIKLLFNYISDTAKVLINGTDYATMYVYLNLWQVSNAMLSNNSYVKVNGSKLQGVFAINYSNVHTADSIVKGNVSLKQVNNVNAIQETISVDLVAIANDTMMVDIISNSSTHKVYSIEYYNGMFSRTIDGYVVSVNENGVFNDTLKIKLVFGVANV